MSPDQPPVDGEGDEKPVNPNLWGLGIGIVALIVFPTTHFLLGFPSTLYNALILPFVIGFIVRWSTKLNYTNPYRDE